MNSLNLRVWHKPLLNLVLILFGLWVFSVAAHAATFHVSATCTTEGNGTSSECAAGAGGDGYGDPDCAGFAVAAGGGLYPMKIPLLMPVPSRRLTPAMSRAIRLRLRPLRVPAAVGVS
jgi:hypothetical protein